MELVLSFEVIFVLGIFLALLVAFLLLIQIYNIRTIQRLSAPVYERIRKETEAEARSILATARSQARDIIGGARIDREELSNVYAEQLAEAKQVMAHAQDQARNILEQAQSDRDSITRTYQEQFDQARSIIANAQDQAQQIIASAKDQREQIVQEYDDQINKLQAAYQVQLESHTKKLTGQIDEIQKIQAERLTEASTEFFEQIIREHSKIRERFERVLSMIEKTQNSVQEESKQAVTSVKEKLQETAQILSDQLESYDTTITETISKHIEHTYEKIDEEMHTYREARKAILDRHIQQIVEDVANRVLRKQLTLTEHAELAREALRQAKEDNVF